MFEGVQMRFFDGTSRNTIITTQLIVKPSMFIHVFLAIAPNDSLPEMATGRFEVNLDSRLQNLDAHEFPMPISQIVDSSRLKWPGFNSQVSPPTLNYSELILEPLANIPVDCWNAILTDAHQSEQGNRDNLGFQAVAIPHDPGSTQQASEDGAPCTP